MLREEHVSWRKRVAEPDFGCFGAKNAKNCRISAEYRPILTFWAENWPISLKIQRSFIKQGRFDLLKRTLTPNAGRPIIHANQQLQVL